MSRALATAASQQREVKNVKKYTVPAAHSNKIRNENSVQQS